MKNMDKVYNNHRDFKRIEKEIFECDPQTENYKFLAHSSRDNPTFSVMNLEDLKWIDALQIIIINGEVRFYTVPSGASDEDIKQFKEALTELKEWLEKSVC